MRRKRTYELKRRAERMEQTRRRIIEATVELHSTIGPARTTLSAVAQRAGVERPTIYSHFPDQGSLFRACSGFVLATDPPPDPSRWKRIPDPDIRLETALREVYAYYGRNRALLANIVRDASLMPIVREVSAPWLRGASEMRKALVVGWNARGPRRRRLLAVLGHALDFSTWESLVGRQGLSEDEAIGVMAELAGRAAGGRAVPGKRRRRARSEGPHGPGDVQGEGPATTVRRFAQDSVLAIPDGDEA